MEPAADESAPVFAQPPTSGSSRHGSPVDAVRACQLGICACGLWITSGYSRVHLVRMFRAVMGYSPHNALPTLEAGTRSEFLRHASISRYRSGLRPFEPLPHGPLISYKSVEITPSAYRRSLGP